MQPDRLAIELNSSADPSQSTPHGAFSGGRLTVAPTGYANARFAVAQTAQDSNRGVDIDGILVNVG
jgi:hypothetical protein